MKQIIGEVYSGNVSSIVSPYLGGDGAPLRSYTALSRVLHPGDVLVWAHHDRLGGTRTGGHTQTIAGIQPDGTILALQGNQPLDEDQADQIRNEVGAGAPSVSQLRSAQARRIEMGALTAPSRRDFPEPQRRGPPLPVWTWSDGTTTLVAAGPPLSAPRSRAHPGVRTVGLTDWSSALRAANAQALPGVFEMALAELRASMENGKPPSVDEATRLGTVAGEALWLSARQAADLAEESHFRALQRMQATITDVAASTRGPRGVAAPIFGAVTSALERSSRGMTSINFRRRGRSERSVHRVLLTGFDPFNAANARQPPRQGEWNPSGSAVLALDGATLSSSTGPIAVESVVLPVSFSAFDTGMVESVVRPLARDVDAVITVSQDPALPLTAPVRLERFAVGARLDNAGHLVPVPGGGPMLIESSAAVESITRRLRRPAPTIGLPVTLGFADPAVGRRVLAALSSSASLVPVVPSSDNGSSRSIAEVGEVTAIQRLLVISRSIGGTQLEIDVGNARVRAVVIAGPGGNFLSNEVSYRTLRTLLDEHSGALSFHVHTQRGTEDEGGVIPQATGGARTRALGIAQEVRVRLIATLRELVAATITEARHNR